MGASRVTVTSLMSICVSILLSVDLSAVCLFEFLESTPLSSSKSSLLLLINQQGGNYGDCVTCKAGYEIYVVYEDCSGQLRYI